MANKHTKNGPIKNMEELCNNKITPKKLNDLMVKLEEFYAQRPKEFSIFKLAGLILRRLKSDRDFFMVFEGMRGTGKSNALMLVMLVMSRYAGIWRNRVTGEIKKIKPRIAPLPSYWEHLEVSFDFENNLSFLDEVEVLKKKFNSIDRYMPFGIDEGSKNLHKYNWQDRLQQQLIQLSDTERYQNKGFFICIPNFKELTTTFRNDRINIRIFLVVRHTEEDYAEAIISAKDESRWTDDPWHIEENKKHFEYTLRKIPVAQRNWKHMMRAEKKLTGYLTSISFPSLKTLSPEIWKTYYRYKIMNAQKEIVHEKGKTSKQLQSYQFAVKQFIAFLKTKHKITWKSIAQICKLSTTQVTNIWNSTTEIEQEYRLMQQHGKVDFKEEEN